MLDKIKTMPRWAVRKTVYLAGALIVAVAGAFGVLSEVQVDQWTDQLDKILTYVIGAGGLLFAGTNTNAASGSTATDADRIDAQDASEQIMATAKQAAHDVAAEVGERTQGLDPAAISQAISTDVSARMEQILSGMPQQVQDAVRGVYDEPYGRHDAAAPEPDPAGPGRYPGSL